MKATMDESGVITLSPDTQIEAFALKVWADQAAFQAPGGLGQPMHWRGTHLAVETSMPSPRILRKYRENCDD